MDHYWLNGSTYSLGRLEIAENPLVLSAFYDYEEGATQKIYHSKIYWSAAAFTIRFNRTALQ